jgi:hypothetical protein
MFEVNELKGVVAALGDRVAALEQQMREREEDGAWLTGAVWSLVGVVVVTLMTGLGLALAKWVGCSSRRASKRRKAPDTPLRGRAAQLNLYELEPMPSPPPPPPVPRARTLKREDS